MEVALLLSEAASVENIVSDVRDDLEKVKKENRELKERFSSMELS
jgi:hypothetical protein